MARTPEQQEACEQAGVANAHVKNSWVCGVYVDDGPVPNPLPEEISTIINNSTIGPGSIDLGEWA